MKITASDFNNLTINSGIWGEEWEEQEDRFDGVDWETTRGVDYSYGRIYWCERYADVILAKLFLDERDFGYEVYLDMADDTYAITTNYQAGAK